jgi:hypothetical protein
MPQGRNHAPAETDGTRLLVFGGRGAGRGDGNVIANGFDTVAVYEPSTKTWISSLDGGSTLAPLLQARGGAARRWLTPRAVKRPAAGLLTPLRPRHGSC